MPQERKAVSTLAQFFKFTAIGQAVAGYIARNGNNDKGEFVVFRPALTRDSRYSEWKRVDEMAVGLATDIAMKMNARADVGRFFLIEYNDSEPTNRGQPKKLFRVVELSKDEMIALRDGKFALPEAETRTREPATTTPAELPF